MPPASTLAYWEGLLLVGGLFGLLLWKLVTGGLPLDQLLEGDFRDPRSADGYTSYVSGARVQSFVISVFGALYYLLQVIHNPKAFPSIPNELLGVLAGSQALYLGGKAQAMLLGRLRDILK